MIGSGRGCEGILTQLAAVRSAIEGVGTLMLNSNLKLCFEKATEGESEDINSLVRAVAIWGRVHIGE